MIGPPFLFNEVKFAKKKDISNKNKEMEVIPGYHDDFQQTDAEAHKDESDDTKSAVIPEQSPPLPSDENTFEKFKQGDKVSVSCLSAVGFHIGFPREYPGYIGSAKKHGNTRAYCVHYEDGGIATYNAIEFARIATRLPIVGNPEPRCRCFG